MLDRPRPNAGADPSVDAPPDLADTDIAIIGMAGRFPGARSIDEYWRNVRNGVESVLPIRDADLLRRGVDNQRLLDPAYVKRAALLPDMEAFDAEFFGFSPREAAILDPQHRHFLECAWEALEDAGRPPEAFSGSIGVYAGSGMNAYFTFHLAPNRRLMDEVGLFLLRHTGNDKDFLPTRLSYLLDLRGPSVAIQTACSTSLVAIHVACQQLLNHECDLALAGGVTIELPHGVGYRYAEGEILSPDGICRPFDADARGTVFGSGVGVVVLRRLADALEAGDRICAVIKGSAVNNDGRGKVGYLAPSVDGQAAAIREALEISGVPAEQIGYVETHGTGTAVGDPIEFEALTQAYRSQTSRRGFCALGSVKANIGHLDTAAGVAGLIKAVKAMEHRTLPPMLHFKAPNPEVDLEGSPFLIDTAAREWTSPAGLPRFAAVNSLGVGGTNAHVILREAPDAPRSGGDALPRLLALSARTPQALQRAAERLADHFESHPDLALADAAFTLQRGRRAFSCRLSLAAGSTAEAVTALRARTRRIVPAANAAAAAPSLVWMFPGGGAQYVGMARDLLAQPGPFRDALVRCQGILRGRGGPDPVALLEGRGAQGEDASEVSLEHPLNSILSVFCVEYGLANLLESWGLQPDALMGHSLGEYVAAHLAGVMSLEDALAIVQRRGEIFAALPAGSMMSVALAPDALREVPTPGVDLAAVNAGDLIVLSGTVDAIAALETELGRRDIECQRIRISVAAHSSLLEPHLAGFHAFLSGLSLQPPTRRLICNVSGQWAGAEVATADYWVRHLRQTVQFAAGVRTALEGKPAVFLEVGPGRALSSFVRQVAAESAATGASVAWPVMRHRDEPVADLVAALDAVGGAWTAGVAIDWSALPGGDQGRRVALPTYPFARDRHWIDAPSVTAAPDPAAAKPAAEPVVPLARIAEPERWITTLQWRQVEPPPRAAGAGRRRILCWSRAEEGLAPLAERLRSAGHAIESCSSAAQVVAALESGDGPDIVLTDLSSWPRLDEKAWSDLAALAAADCPLPRRLVFLTRGLWSVDGEASTAPEQALAVGIASVLDRENPSLVIRCLDLPVDPSRELLDAAVAELFADVDEARVALRSSGRWAHDFVARLAGEPDAGIAPKRGGTYLLTGAFGGLGRLLAAWLARHYGARLILLGRALPPDMAEIEKQLRDAGAEVLGLGVDLLQADELAAAITRARGQFGAIDVAFHLAGRIDDAPLQNKRFSAAAEVLAPKVEGTVNLAAALGSGSGHFLVLFSSTSSFLGLPGQCDYAAANLFLEAWAGSAAGRQHRARVVHWGAWQDVGMTSAPSAPVSPDGAPFHPLLGGPTRRPGGSSQSFVSEHAAAACWWLDEHRLRGDRAAIMPGMAFVEVLAAAARQLLPTGRHAMLRRIALLQPMILADDAPRTMRSTFQRDNGAWLASVDSLEEGGWTRHAEARLESTGPTSERIDLAAVAARCRGRVLSGNEISGSQERTIAFGPRWRAASLARYGESEALVDLDLPVAFLEADRDFGLHPAMVDAALAGALQLLPEETVAGLWVPFSIDEVHVHAAALSRRAFAHVRLVERGAAFSRLDLVIVDSTGRVELQLTGLSMRRVPDVARAATGSPARALQSMGLRREDAPMVFDLAIARASTAPMVVSTLPPAAVLRAVRSWWPRPKPAVDVATVQGGGTADGASADSVEQALTTIWRDLLGVEHVGPDDDFFQLGGHSLLGIRLFSRIEKRFGRKFELSTLFEARTVRELAQRVSEGRRSRWRALTPITTAGRSPPFYCVHAVGGEVLTYLALSQAIGEDQSFYAFRAPGHDGSAAPLTSIAEQAELYLSELLAFQPEGPYLIGGYSHGARVAFEMATRLEAAGRRPALVALIDTWASEALPRGAGWPLRLAANLPAWMSQDLLRSTRAENMDRLRRGALSIRNVLHKGGSKSSAEGQSNLQEHMDTRLLPDSIRAVFEANFQAFTRFEPRAYGGPVTVFRATAQPLRSPHFPDHGWGRFTRGVQVIPIPGNHFNIIAQPRVETLGKALRAEIDRALEEPKSP